MPDIDETLFDDTPIEGMEQAFQDWTEPPERAAIPQPGVNWLYIDKDSLDDLKEYDGYEGKGKNLFGQLTYLCENGDGGVSEIRYVRMSSSLRENRGRISSSILDLLKSLNIEPAPTSNRQIVEALKMAAHGKTRFKAQVDWEALCMACRDEYLLRETKRETMDLVKHYINNLPKDAARKLYDGANKAGTLARSYRGFQLGPNDLFIPEIKCPKHGVMVPARARIVRYLAPGF